MGKWLAPNAPHCSHCLEETKRPLIQLIRLFNKHNRDHLQIQTHSEEVHVPKPLEKLTFSDDNSDSDEEKGTMLILIQHLKQVVP
jgi:hypothetical protein